MKYLNNEELVRTLREMADFYSDHPDIPAPGDFSYGWMRVYLPGDKAKTMLRSIGSFTKTMEDENFLAIRRVGEIDLTFVADREKVCERKVVGKKTVPAVIIPAKFEQEQVIPEHEEDIVEWDCKPILEPECESAS